jgi:hypothetical protein
MASNEWTTVPKRGGYVPPYLRAKMAAEEAKKKAEEPVNVGSTTHFPTLGRAAAAAGGGVGHGDDSPSPTDKLDFKQKIKDLIALEQRSEIEREAAEAEKQKMMGFVSLPLPVTKERLSKMYNHNRDAEERENHMRRLKICGMLVDPTNPLPLAELEEMDHVLLEEE